MVYDYVKERNQFMHCPAEKTRQANHLKLVCLSLSWSILIWSSF